MPPCRKCESPYSQRIDAEHSHNISLGSVREGALAGTWCFVLEGGIDTSTATLIVSPVDSEGHSTSSIEEARWVLHAPDCPAGQVEVQTFDYVEEAGKLVTTPDGEVGFSFVVP